MHSEFATWALDSELRAEYYNSMVLKGRGYE